mmetsp:Transcript_46870/g.145148  ORF Transcript_46870/g.145148 Transcript_46870/m.145148 type:complete len:241 (+) Transcript_46870:225-947(+)
MLRMASAWPWMSCCVGTRRPSRLSRCSWCCASSEHRAPLVFSQCCVSLCKPVLVAAVDCASSPTSFANSKCRPLRLWASSLICADRSASSAMSFPVLVAPACSERMSPSKSSLLCCSTFNRAFVVRRSAATFARSVFVDSWSSPSLSFSRCVVPRSFRSFSRSLWWLEMLLRWFRSSSCCRSMQSRLSSCLSLVSLRRFASCCTCAWSSFMCSEMGCTMLYTVLRTKACMLPASSMAAVS